jgi:hypothetical protein
MDFILAFTYKKTIILLLALLAPALTHESCSSITSFTLCDVLAGPGVPGGPWNKGPVRSGLLTIFGKTGPKPVLNTSRNRQDRTETDQDRS